MPDGRYWARLPLSRGRKSLGIWPSEKDAREVLEAALQQLAVAPVIELRPKGETFATFGLRVLDMREEDGIRDMSSERSRFRVHLERSSIANRLITSIQPVDLSDLQRAIARKFTADTCEPRKINRKTVLRVMSVVSAIFDVAVDRGIRADNPMAAVKFKKKQSEQATEDPWTWLTIDEQKQIATCQEIPEYARCLIMFAIGTGLRQGEQWNLELRDLQATGDAPQINVRFGSKGYAPKNGKIRTVQLFGVGLQAATRWLELLPSWAPDNEAGVVFPATRGGRRCKGAPSYCHPKTGRRLRLLPVWLKAAGITRPVRWHDLRHTCASSLISGVWGRRWSLEEIKEQLGHASISMTQKYAHLGETSLKRAASETRGF